jgi:hypothetical protein
LLMLLCFLAGKNYARKKPDRGEEHTVMEAICSLDFWLLFMVMVCSLGSGTTAMDNMGQIGLSLGYTQVQINTLVALLSIWNCFGRFGGGFISELLLHSKDIPRPFSLVLSLVSESFDMFVCVCMHVCFFTYQFQKMEPPSFEMINPP